MRPALGLLAATLLVALAPSATAQTYSNQVRAQLDAAEQALRGPGFRPTPDYEIGSLDDGAEESFTLRLSAEREYALVGACDADCDDMDFWLYDENDNLIDSDTSTDDVPIVRVTPRWSGTFRIRVRMYECSVEPCYYGSGVFGG